MMKYNAICPVCGRVYSGYPALSRFDNETEICARCGAWEAMAIYWKNCKDVEKEDNKNDGSDARDLIA